jgi:hypothetical protein
VVARLGTEQTPITLMVRQIPQPEPTPWYDHWWLWGAAAAVVTAAVVGVVALSADGADTPDGTLDPIRLD